jgi:hypothetical protein
LGFVRLGFSRSLPFDLPSFLAERVEGVLAATGSTSLRVTWSLGTWVQLPGGAVDVAVDEALVALLLDAAELPPGLDAALRISRSYGQPADLVVPWVWAELRARSEQGLPLTFRSAVAAIVSLPIALSAALETLETPRVKHVDLAAEAGLGRRRFEARVAEDPTRAGRRTVEVRVRSEEGGPLRNTGAGGDVGPPGRPSRHLVVASRGGHAGGVVAGPAGDRDCLDWSSRAVAPRADPVGRGNRLRGPLGAGGVTLILDGGGDGTGHGWGVASAGETASLVLNRATRSANRVRRGWQPGAAGSSPSSPTPR